MTMEDEKIIKEMRKSIDMQLVTMQAMSETISLLLERIKRFENIVEKKQYDGNQASVNERKVLFLHPKY